MNRNYDFIFCGGGAAGLSLAYHLSQSPLREKRMLIIDRVLKRHNDHTWCSWLKGSAPFDEIAYRSWPSVAFCGADFEATFDLAPYRYRMLRGADFYRHTREVLGACPNVDFLLGDVTQIVDGPQDAEVWVNEQVYRGTWIFDSRYNAQDYRPLTRRYHYLNQHFWGWEVETTTPAFDPQRPMLFDFRTPQRGQMRFFYVLPYSERRALVEFTIFSKALLPQADYPKALRNYIADVLGLQTYQVRDEEHDRIPMSDHPAPRQQGKRVLATGTRGGRVKASSGYAFQRIQRDSAAIVRSLNTHGHPFAIPQAAARYAWFDSLLLQVLEQRGELGKTVFSALFKNNPIQRIFRFLDEDAGWGENLQLIASLPPSPFLAAWLRVLMRGFNSSVRRQE